MPARRIELRIGDVTLRILKVTKSHAGDVYAMPPTPTGLHVSHHASGKRHIRDDLGFHRDLVEPVADADLEEIAKLVMYDPSPDASLVVMRPTGQPELAQPPEGNVATLTLDQLKAALGRFQLARVAGRQFVDLLRLTRGSSS